jgi:hypothetical protein
MTFGNPFRYQEAASDTLRLLAEEVIETYWWKGELAGVNVWKSSVHVSPGTLHMIYGARY